MKVYDSPFSSIVFEPDSKLLVASWDKSSQALNENGVKAEIRRILDYLSEYNVENIIVDSRQYQFREHADIQLWINFEFMPLIANSRVRKYGIVVAAPLDSEGANPAEDTSELAVEYFTSLDDAMRWVKGAV